MSRKQSEIINVVTAHTSVTLWICILKRSSKICVANFFHQLIQKAIIKSHSRGCRPRPARCCHETGSPI